MPQFVFRFYASIRDWNESGGVGHGGEGVCVCVGGGGGCIHIFNSNCSNPSANSEEGVVDQHFPAKPFQTMCRKRRNGNQHPFHAIFSPKLFAPLSVNRGDIRPKTTKTSLPLQTAWIRRVGVVHWHPPPPPPTHTHTKQTKTHTHTHLKPASPVPNSMNKDRGSSSLRLHPYPPTLSKAYVIKEGSSGPTIPPPPPYTQNPITTI